MSDAFDKMDRMYRYQRHFYDLTRKYYLLGRDRLLQQMEIKPDEHVLEVGCGTGRNLKILATHHPESRFYGLDASSVMLDSARAKLERANLTNVVLRRALAEDFAFDDTLGLDTPFDKIFFSYSISMIPTWRDAIEKALKNLKPGGKIFIVDFYDHAELPTPFREFLQWWLGKFHVQYWSDLIPFLEKLESERRVKLTVTPLFRRYSFLASLTKTAIDFR